MVDSRYWCGRYNGCVIATDNLCEKFGFYGLSGGGGGFSEYVTIAPKNLIPLPESAPLHVAALIEPLAVAWHRVKRADLKPSITAFVLVLGGGPIVLALLVVLKARGWRNIYVSEPSAHYRCDARPKCPSRTILTKSKPHGDNVHVNQGVRRSCHDLAFRGSSLDDEVENQYIVTAEYAICTQL